MAYIVLRKKVLTLLLDRFLPKSLRPLGSSIAPIMDSAIQDIANQIPLVQPIQASSNQEVMKSPSTVEPEKKIEATTQQMSPKTFKFKVGEFKVKIYNHKFKFKLAEVQVVRNSHL